MMRRAVFYGLVLAAAVGGLAFRLPRLCQRPMHTDEAVQALKTGCLAEAGDYCYDPTEFHGPSLYYLTLPSLWLTAHGSLADSDESTFRIVPVIFGTGLILLLLLVGDGLGWPAAVWAALLTAISPAMVFYSRYYIQEMLLVFFTFASIAAVWRYVQSRRMAWALTAGLALGLTHATKETCLVSFAAMGISVIIARRWPRLGTPSPQLSLHRKDLLWGGAAACLVSVTFFSSFFKNPRGPLDSILTYVGYLRKGAGQGVHDHPWYYYLKMLLYTKYAPGPWWSEGLIVAFSLIGLVAVLLQSRHIQGHLRFLTFLVLYTVAMITAYSAIPYKTPWCMLSFLQGMILLAGVGADVLVKAMPNLAAQAAMAGVLTVGSGHLAWQAYQASFRFYADPRDPYVYAHPVSDILNLCQMVENISRVHPDGHRMLIKVIAPKDDYWPLPWYLRKFERVGYWSHVPEDPDAPVLIVSSELDPEVDYALKDTYTMSCFGLRPRVVMCLYVQKDLWKRFVESQCPVNGP